jgi:multiple sugar transport system substrate-binding protein
MSGAKMTRREVLQCATAAACTALLAACQQQEPTRTPLEPAKAEASEEPTTAPTVKPSEPVTVTWWNPDTALWQPAYKKMAETFMEQNPSIKVDIQNVPEEGFVEKINAMIAGGMGPDVWPWFYAVETPRHGFINNLTPYVERDGLRAEELWFPICLKRGQYQNQQYGTPRDGFWSLIVYNKDLFDEFGAPYPEEGWTLDDYLSKAQVLTSEEKGTWGTLISGLGALMADSAFGWNMGFEVVSEDGRQVQGLLDSEASIEAIQWMLDLQVEHKVAPSGPLIQALGDFPFTSGKAGMDVACGLWHLSALREVQFQWGLVPAPIKKGGEAHPWGDSVQYYMWTGSKQKDAAWELMKYASSPEGSKFPATLDCWPSPCPQVWLDLGWDKDPIMVGFWRQAQMPTKVPQYVRTEFHGDCVGPNLEAIFTRYIENNERPLEPLVRQAAEEAQSCLDDRYAKT